MSNLIAEDLLLLLLDDQTGKMTNSSSLRTGVGGALLVELALTEAVRVVEDPGFLARAKVEPTSVLSPDDSVLADALVKIREKPRTAQDLVDRLGKDQRDVLLGRLADRGILNRDEGRVLGLFPRTTWPTRDSSYETALRQRLRDVLVRNAEPDPRTAALIAVLSAMGIAHKVVDDEGTGGRPLKARAKQVAEGNWAAKAVKDSIAAAQAAVAASIAASSATASAGSS